MATKLVVQKNLVFPITVEVPMPGQVDNEKVCFLVKFLTISEYSEKFPGDFKYLDFVQEVVTGWDIESEFNQDNLSLLFDYFPMLPKLIVDAYHDEYTKGYEKN